MATPFLDTSSLVKDHWFYAMIIHLILESLFEKMGYMVPLVI